MLQVISPCTMSLKFTQGKLAVLLGCTEYGFEGRAVRSRTRQRLRHAPPQPCLKASDPLSFTRSALYLPSLN